MDLGFIGVYLRLGYNISRNPNIGMIVSNNSKNVLLLEINRSMIALAVMFCEKNDGEMIIQFP